MDNKTDEFYVLQLAEGCFYVKTNSNFGTVGNPLLATRLGDLDMVKENLLLMKSTFIKAKIMAVKVNFKLTEI